MSKVKCAVLGASGVVGQNFLRLLVNHPYFELGAICASDSRVGKPLSSAQPQIEGGIPTCFRDLIFDPIDVDILLSKEIQVVFSGLPSDVAKEIETEAARKGLKVFSNAGSHRMDADVPILIPEVNHPHLQLTEKQDTDGFIVTNANCTTTGLTMALLPIQQFDIKKLVVASYQAISGAGYPGIPSMDIISNVIPYISSEEPKMVEECRKIYGSVHGSTIEPTSWEIYPHCVRVQTIIGHLISVHAEIANPTTLEAVKEAILTYESPKEVAGLPTAPEKPVLYTEETARPQPRWDIYAGTPDRARGQAVVIGRLSVENNIIRFITLSNNLIRGAAGGSVLNAELAYRKNLL